MKKFLALTLLIAAFQVNAQNKKDKFGLGFHRISYLNVYNCKTEFQSFDTTITEQKLDRLMSFMYRIGSKDRGLENEFKTYRSYDFSTRSDNKTKLVAYSKQQIQDFEASMAKLRTASVPREFESLKIEILDVHSKRLKFEKVFADWYASGNDVVFRKQILGFYSDVYIISTLNKTLAIKDMNEKWKYSYAELYDIVFARVFNYDKVNEIQNKLMFDYKIDVVIDPNCTKS